MSKFQLKPHVLEVQQQLLKVLRATALGISKKETFFQLNKQTLLLLTDVIVDLQ